jgi:hypothetical protein
MGGRIVLVEKRKKYVKMENRNGSFWSSSMEELNGLDEQKQIQLLGRLGMGGEGLISVVAKSPE